MYFGAFLIILSNIHIFLVYGFKSNYSENDNCSLCTFSLFRRKRALSEYTRWRSNPETTQAFIVKVLDDDVTIPTSRNQIVDDATSRPTSRQVVAVNIQPLKRGEENIIVERATFLSSTVTPDLSMEYTRFVPPTLTLTRFEGDMMLDPISPVINDNIPPIKPKSKVLKGEQQIGPILKFGGDRHSQRDESPPSGPQFIQRSNPEVRQYAPVATVIFTKQNTLGPLTPRTVDKFMLYKTTIHPTRTSPLLDIVVPFRTPDFFNPLIFEDETKYNKPFPTRTTLMPIGSPQRTPKSSSIGDDEDDILDTTIQTIELQRRKGIEKKLLDKETDFYRKVLHGYSKNDSTTKIHGYTESDEDDLDKSDIGKDSIKDALITRIRFSALDDLDEYENTTEVESHLDYDDEDDLKNGTTLTTRFINGITTLESTTKSMKEAIKKNRTCNLVKLRQLTFSAPRTLHEIIAQLKQWAEESPVAKWVDITAGNFTVMENPIHMMIVDDPSSGQIISAKQTVMIVAGIQGRDHHAVAAAMYVLYQLIERSEAHSDLLTKYRFWIIPVFNPDGYAYSMTFPRRREWIKNLKQTWDSCKGRDSCKSCELYGVRCTIQPCYGVNLDRNFEYQWIPPEELRSEHPCGPLFAGPRQLSEAETRALTHYLHEQKAPLYTFIAFKEGDVLGVMYPYSHTRKKRAFDHVYRQRASSAASAAYSISGRPYVAGQTSEFLPLYAGGIEDWVDGHLGIDNTYTVMMFRPTDAQNSKIITERVVHEAYAAIDTLLLQSVEPLGPPPVTITRSGAHCTPSSFLLCIFTILLPFGAT